MFRSSPASTDEHTQGNDRVSEKQVLQDNLQILRVIILNSQKKSITTYLNLNKRNKINDLKILI